MTRTSGRQSATGRKNSRKGEVIRELLGLLGVTAVRKLVEAKGGTSLRIPLGMTLRGQAQLDALAQLLGNEAVKRLVGRYGGTMLYVPFCRQTLLDSRDQSINRERDALARKGVGERELVANLARQHGLSDRQIWRILKKSPVIPAEMASCIAQPHSHSARC